MWAAEAGPSPSLRLLVGLDNVEPRKKTAGREENGVRRLFAFLFLSDGSPQAAYVSQPEVADFRPALSLFVK